MGSVGAIPYYADIRVLDRIGLTDAHVARSPVALQNGRRLMAHDKAATIEYARERGVDLWTYDPVHLLEPAAARRILVAIRDALVDHKEAWAAAISDSEYVLCRLPMGPEYAARRLPRLQFVPVVDSAFIASWSVPARASFEAALARDPNDDQALGQLAFVQLVSRDYARAAQNYVKLLSAAPDSPEAWEYLGICRVRLGDLRGGVEALGRSVDGYRAIGDAATAGRIEQERLALMPLVERGAGARPAPAVQQRPAAGRRAAR
jgi:hypothetical protein